MKPEAAADPDAIGQARARLPFGSTGHVMLYEIDSPALVVVLAVRHQREEDYH